MMNRYSKFLFSFLAVFAALFPLLAFAITVTDISDLVSSSQISVGSNHKFILTIADDISEGEDLQITFPTGFLLTSMTEDDVDITDDGIDIATAVDCSGIDASSVSIAGQTVTVSICPGDGGAISSGSIITIEIGTNAAFSGLGIHRITNPSAVATWFLNFSGTSGNSGSVILATTTVGPASVSATVPAAETPPSNGGGGGAGDTPPSIPPITDIPVNIPPDVVPPVDTIPPAENPPGEDSPVSPVSTEDPSSGGSSPVSHSSGGGTSSTSSGSIPSNQPITEIIDVPGAEGTSALPETPLPMVEPSGETQEPTGIPTKILPRVEEAFETIQALVANILSGTEEASAFPEVQQVVNIAIPISSILAVASTVVLLSSFNLLSYVQFLFTSPLLLFDRRKRKAFGVVYNSVTKIPIELATVRLYDVRTNRLVRSAVTDVLGKYFFIANPGEYRLSVKKNTWTFPSTYLGGTKDDGVYLDVYTGQSIIVTEKDATIAANIPLDYLVNSVEHTKQGLLNRRLLRKLQFIFSISGVFLSIGIFFLSPSALTLLLASGQIIVFLFCLRLARVKRPRGWGIVYDDVTHRPVGNAVVRLFEPKYNKLVESTLTDTLGRYSFLVGPNEYFVRTDKLGYDEHIVRPIDYRQKTEPSAIAIDVPLTPAKPV